MINLSLHKFFGFFKEFIFLWKELSCFQFLLHAFYVLACIALLIIWWLLKEPFVFCLCWFISLVPRCIQVRVGFQQPLSGPFVKVFEIQSTIDQRARQQHRHGVKIVFINRTTITHNLVSIYTLEIRAHFECIKIVLINRTTITYNLVSIYTPLEIRAHFERTNNIGMAWGTERD